MTLRLPQGWTATSIGAVIDGFEAGRNLRANGRPADASEYGVLKVSAVSWGSFRPEENKALLPGDKPRPNEVVRSGDVLISRANTSELVGAVVRVVGDHERLMLPDKILRLRVRVDLVDPDFLVHALRTSAVRRHFEEHATGTSDSMRNLSQPKIEAAPLLLPPRNEQRRIVAKFESLQARNRRARGALDAVPPLLERLRQSILAAAFRGDLTKDWRATHKDVEPASELLKRIRAERRKKWEDNEFAKMKPNGRAPLDDRWKAKYKEPEPVDAAGLPELPHRWCWASVEELASDEPRSIQSGPFGSNLLHSEFTQSGVLVIGIDNVRDGAFSMGAQHRITEEKFRTLEKYAARPGDVLVTVMATVGRCCTVPEDLEPAIITKHVYRISPERRLVRPDYLMHSMRGAPALRDAMKGDIRGQTRPGINGGIIRGLPVPLAPIAEQDAVLDAVDACLRQANNVGHASLEVRRHLGILDRAILAKAFRGELVPQDPNDEAADVMLARSRSTASVGGRTRQSPAKDDSGGARP